MATKDRLKCRFWEDTSKSEVQAEGGDYLADVRDAKAAFETLSSQDTLDPERVAVLGQSAGVYTTCLLAKKNVKNIVDNRLDETNQLSPE